MVAPRESHCAPGRVWWRRRRQRQRRRRRAAPGAASTRRRTLSARSAALAQFVRPRGATQAAPPRPGGSRAHAARRGVAAAGGR
eukprot:954580-Prymnesium_polylepis.1